MDGDINSFGPDLKKHLRLLSNQYMHQQYISLEKNIVHWIENQYRLLLRILPSNDGKSYSAKILFSNER